MAEEEDFLDNAVSLDDDVVDDIVNSSVSLDDDPIDLLISTDRNQKVAVFNEDNFFHPSQVSKRKGTTTVKVRQKS